ncbi:MAG: hypothetical protein O3C17_08040 [Planctomycetota bacterium]|nr:hypothetical protein [Planctomycetota bacterium]
MMKPPQIAALAVAALIPVGVLTWSSVPPQTEELADGTLRVRVEFSGGYETDPVDHGRPVRLIAGALGVDPEVFRDAFSRVNPAPAGSHPDHERVRENKEALMSALGPFGITNDRLDDVSDQYRYEPGRGGLWPHKVATAYAIVKDGAVTRFEVTDPGYGYNAPPKIKVPGIDGSPYETLFVAELSFGPDFEKNGSIFSIAGSGWAEED